MATHHLQSALYAEGLEVNRDDEGLQWKSRDAVKQPGLQYKEEAPFPPYRQLGSNLQTTQEATERRNPWGLGPLAFGLLIASITAIVVGAAVGGGVGGALSSSHDSSPPATTTITTNTHSTAAPTAAGSAPSSTSTTNIIDYVVPLPQNVETIEWDCPTINSFTTTNLNPNQNFNVACGVDNNNGIAAEQGGIVADIVGILAYSAQHCMDACSYMNQFASDWGFPTKCAGITFSQDMRTVYTQYGGNCWLKNGTAVNPLTCSSCLSATVA